MADKIHLWRPYQSAPFYRFACTIVEAPTGFKVVRHNAAVADGPFLAALDHHFQRTHNSFDSEDTAHGVAEIMTQVHPGDPSYFRHAAESFAPTAYIRPSDKR